jgi:hypothetical protein
LDIGPDTAITTKIKQFFIKMNLVFTYPAGFSDRYPAFRGSGYTAIYWWYRYIIKSVLHFAVPDPETGRPGCQLLERLLIFDTAIFEKEVATVVVHLPHLSFLGYKETGKVELILFSYPTVFFLLIDRFHNHFPFR